VDLAMQLIYETGNGEQVVKNPSLSKIVTMLRRVPPQEQQFFCVLQASDDHFVQCIGDHRLQRVEYKQQEEHVVFVKRVRTQKQQKHGWWQKLLFGAPPELNVWLTVAETIQIFTHFYLHRQVPTAAELGEIEKMPIAEVDG
jgi:hypothetical protein